jgi:hypothetical protein
VFWPWFSTSVPVICYGKRNPLTGRGQEKFPILLITLRFLIFCHLVVWVSHRIDGPYLRGGSDGAFFNARENADF